MLFWWGGWGIRIPQGPGDVVFDEVVLLEMERPEFVFWDSRVFEEMIIVYKFTQGEDGLYL